MRAPQKMQQPRGSGEVPEVVVALEAPEEEHGRQDQLGVAAEGISHLLTRTLHRDREAAGPCRAAREGEEAVQEEGGATWLHPGVAGHARPARDACLFIRALQRTGNGPGIRAGRRDI